MAKKDWEQGYVQNGDHPMEKPTEVKSKVVAIWHENREEPLLLFHQRQLFPTLVKAHKLTRHAQWIEHQEAIIPSHSSHHKQWVHISQTELLESVVRVPKHLCASPANSSHENAVVTYLHKWEDTVKDEKSAQDLHGNSCNTAFAEASDWKDDIEGLHVLSNI